MKKFLKVFVFLFICGTAFANDYVKFKGWKQAETKHFRSIYEAVTIIYKILF